MTDPSGLRVIEALCPSVSRYALACPQPKWPDLMPEPLDEWYFVETYDGLPTLWNPHLFWNGSVAGYIDASMKRGIEELREYLNSPPVAEKPHTVPTNSGDLRMRTKRDILTPVASPFRYNKKERRRRRKSARRAESIAAFLEEKNRPSDMARRSAELRLEMANSRRKKKPTKPGTHN